MKVKSLELTNFAGCSEVKVNFDDTLTYLIGPNGSNKSTIGLNGIWFAMQGIASRKVKESTPLMGERFLFVGDNKSSAQAKLVLHDVEKDIDITIERKITKSGGTELSIMGPDDMILDQSYLDRLFSVFMISPKMFINLDGKSQALLLGLNIDEYNEKIKSLKSDYTILNSGYLGYGSLDEKPEKVEGVDYAKLNEKKNKIIEFNREQESLSFFYENKEQEIAIVKAELEEQRLHLEELQSQLKEMSKGEKPIDLKPLEEQINNAHLTNKKALEYEAWERDVKKKAEVKKQMEKNKEEQKAVIEQKNKYLQEKELPFDELSIDEDGRLLYDERPLTEPYFSSGELIKIVPIIMSTQNPELKYVFIQQFNLLDDDNQKEVVEYLTERGFQLCIEWVGSDGFDQGNNILMSEI